MIEYLNYACSIKGIFIPRFSSKFEANTSELLQILHYTMLPVSNGLSYRTGKHSVVVVDEGCIIIIIFFENIDHQYDVLH